MILSDKDIKKAIKEKEIIISPIEKDAIGSASVDLCLDGELLFYSKEDKAIDVRNPDTYSNLKKITFKDDEKIVLFPGMFVLGVTKESVELPANIAARIDGRSSLGRLGLGIHSTSGHIDPGFKGKIVLEISNINFKPIIIYKGLKICQLVFERLESPTTIPYNEKKNARYKDVKTVEGSKL